MWRNNENDSSSDNYQFFNVVMIPGFVLCSPLPAAFDRVLQVGDASGIQSPISFGGFGAIIRHLSRLSNGHPIHLKPLSLLHDLWLQW
jgi:hypothetical protein